MGDRNVDSYDVTMKKLMEIVPAIESVSRVSDSKSLEDREN